MFLEPSNIRIIRHGLAGMVRIYFGSRVQPFMGFHVSIRKRDGTATIMIVGGDIPGRCLRAGIHHVYDKKSVVNGVPTFVDEHEGISWAGLPMPVFDLGFRLSCV